MNINKNNNNKKRKRLCCGHSTYFYVHVLWTLRSCTLAKTNNNKPKPPPLSTALILLHWYEQLINSSKYKKKSQPHWQETRPERRRTEGFSWCAPRGHSPKDHCPRPASECAAGLLPRSKSRQRCCCPLDTDRKTNSYITKARLNLKQNQTLGACAVDRRRRLKLQRSTDVTCPGETIYIALSLWPTRLRVNA